MRLCPERVGWSEGEGKAQASAQVMEPLMRPAHMIQAVFPGEEAEHQVTVGRDWVTLIKGSQAGGRADWPSRTPEPRATFPADTSTASGLLQGMVLVEHSGVP